MSSQAPTTPVPGTLRAVAPAHAVPPRSEIDLLTLTITAIASAAAAFVCSHVWAAGTLPSAAFTPVLVALVKEGLRRPTEAVVPGGRVRPERQRIVHHWRIAAATGLAGFALFALIATTTELLSGRSATGRDAATTLFGGTRTVVVNQSTVTVKTVAPQVTTVVKEAPAKTTTVTAPARTKQPTDTVPTTPTQSTPTPAPAPGDGTPTPAAP